MLYNKKLKALNNHLKNYFVEIVTTNPNKEHRENSLAYFEYANRKFSNTEEKFKKSLTFFSIINDIYFYTTILAIFPISLVLVAYNLFTIHALFFVAYILCMILILVSFQISTRYTMNNWKLYLDNLKLIFNLRMYNKHAENA